MSYFYGYVIAVLAIIGLIGSYIRDKSYRALFNSLKRRDVLVFLYEPQSSWTEDERIVFGKSRLKSIHGHVVKQLKLLLKIVPEHDLTEKEQGLVKNIRIGQQSPVPLLIFVCYLLVRHVFVPLFNSAI